MASISRPRVFLDVSIGEEPAGRLTIELFTDKAPKTCENFRQLCTGEHKGLSYATTPFHRVIEDFMIQGGDIANGDGTGVTSIYGQEFEDENLRWRDMDAAGLVCSANRGRDTNGSQFFITLDETPHLNGKHTILGRLVSGEDTLQRIAKADVDKDDRPLVPVLISRCGELERRKKQKAPVLDGDMSNSASRDRGRRRKSFVDEDVSMSPEPEPPRQRPARHRRQSDNVVDETIRGRPRQRSRSRTPTNAIEEDSSQAEPESPVQLHKRKRSPSPSRHERQEGDQAYERRRRSLPNQYRDENHRKSYGEDDRYRPSPRRDGHGHAGQRQQDGFHGRRNDDSYRPSREREGYDEDGRLGGGGYESNEPAVKFKGRGVMKYREPGRL